MSIQIVESVTGIWHYHLSDDDGWPSKALCGARTMACGAALDSWGYKPDHMRSSYCGECAMLGGIKTEGDGE